MTNDKSRNIVAQHLECGGLFSSHCTAILLLCCCYVAERIFKIDEHLTKLRAKQMIVLHAQTAFQVIRCAKHLFISKLNKLNFSDMLYNSKVWIEQ